ncbi:hypothetical protein N802_07355 [Knoellia sinensis KCTC 19936]|uniref:Uncharacterized protein n=1 Tax=Knoellia sinensis KCTC 19936 TaxID=1385520 RepID=A0A0A0J9Z4_9MICO|nr:hypothetical protein [Knoellia sinensis]KGN33943.1 hypothetical protein N802_07355 [Knoellia sinensis KCTC 19936]
MPDPILELLAAPPSPSLAVDEDAVYAGGRRRLRRRALRRTGLGVVGVVGAAAITFGALGSGVRNDALPAVPSPSVSVGKPVSATVLDGRYAVEVIPGDTGDQPNVTFYKIEDGKRTQLAQSLVDSTVVSMGTGTGADGVMLGTAPVGLAKSLTSAPEAKGGIQQDDAPLPGTEFKAYALKFDNPADVGTYRDTFWMDDAGSGAVRDGMGNRVLSTRLAETDTFFVDRESGVMGVFTRDGGSMKPLTREEAITTMGYGQQHDGGDWTWRSVTLLPSEARNIEFSWAADNYHSEVFTESLPNGTEVAAFADATGPGSGAGPRVTKVTWTDEAGVRHTEEVK